MTGASRNKCLLWCPVQAQHIVGALSFTLSVVTRNVTLGFPTRTLSLDSIKGTHVGGWDPVPQAQMSGKAGVSRPGCVGEALGCCRPWRLGRNLEAVGAGWYLTPWPWHYDRAAWIGFLIFYRHCTGWDGLCAQRGHDPRAASPTQPRVVAQLSRTFSPHCSIFSSASLRIC